MGALDRGVMRWGHGLSLQEAEALYAKAKAAYQAAASATPYGFGVIGTHV